MQKRLQKEKRERNDTSVDRLWAEIPRYVSRTENAHARRATFLGMISMSKFSAPGELIIFSYQRGWNVTISKEFTGIPRRFVRGIASPDFWPDCIFREISFSGNSLVSLSRVPGTQGIVTVSRGSCDGWSNRLQTFHSWKIVFFFFGSVKLFATLYRMFRRWKEFQRLYYE